MDHPFNLRPSSRHRQECRPDLRALGRQRLSRGRSSMATTRCHQGMASQRRTPARLLQRPLRLPPQRRRSSPVADRTSRNTRRSRLPLLRAWRSLPVCRSPRFRRRGRPRLRPVLRDRPSRLPARGQMPRAPRAEALLCSQANRVGSCDVLSCAGVARRPIPISVQSGFFCRLPLIRSERHACLPLPPALASGDRHGRQPGSPQT